MQSIGIASGAYVPGQGTKNATTEAVLDLAGVGATTTPTPSLQDIARAVTEGRGVIVNYDTRPVWGGLSSASPTPLGHAVRVTGVEYSQYGELTGFRINDSGNGKANMRVSASKMQAALDGAGGGQTMTTTDAPIPKCGVKKPPPGWKPTPPPTPGGGIMT